MNSCDELLKRLRARRRKEMLLKLELLFKQQAEFLTKLYRETEKSRIVK